MGDLRVDGLSDFEVEVGHLSDIEFAKKSGKKGNNFLLLGDEVFVDGVGDGTESILVVALVFEEEAVELFGGEGLSGFEGLDIIE